MTRFRVVGFACDASTSYTDDGDPVHRYGDSASGALCGDEYTLYGGATYADVARCATQDGWLIRDVGRDRVHLCPDHVTATRA